MKISSAVYIQIASLISLVLFFFVLKITLHQPWLGFSVVPGILPSSVPENKSNKGFSNNLEGWQISSISKSSSLDSAYVGSYIVALSGYNEDKNFEPFIVEGRDLIRQPDTLNTYSDFNAFIVRQNHLMTILSSSRVVLFLNSGEQLVVQPSSYRPVSSLPLDFWLLVVSGLIAWLASVTIWVFRNNYAIGGSFLAITGFGYLLITMCHATYSNREISLAADTLIMLNRTTYLGALMFAFSTLTSTLILPKRLIENNRLWVSVLFVVLLWLNNIWQFIEWPFHAFLFPFMVAFLICIPIVAYQYAIAPRWENVGKSFRWIIFAMFSTIFLATVLYSLPVAFSFEPIVGDTWFVLWLFGFFVAAACVMLHFSLFNILRWWRFLGRAWLLGLVGMAIIVVYMHSYLSGQWYSVVTAIVIACLFFVFGYSYKMTVKSHEFVGNTITSLNTIYSDHQPSVDKVWKTVLINRFKPQQIRLHPSMQSGDIGHSGLTLILPAVFKDTFYELEGKYHSTALFNQEDLSEALGIYELLCNMSLSKDNMDKNVLKERQRIMRDLHDDVSPALLGIVHNSQESNVLAFAHEALNNLRETIYNLDDRNSFKLSDILLRLEADSRQSLSSVNIQLDWMPDVMDLENTLGPMQSHNLTRIFTELIANIIKHSRANNARCRIKFQSGSLLIILSDDGAKVWPDRWTPGIGMKNIIRRVEEGGGDVSWHKNANDYCQYPCGSTAVVNFPL